MFWMSDDAQHWELVALSSNINETVNVSEFNAKELFIESAMNTKMKW